MRKFSKVLCLLMMVVLVMSACSSNNGGNTNNAVQGNSPATDNSKDNAKVEEKEEVTLTAWAWNVNVGALNSAIELYKKEHPNVNLKVEDIGRLDVYDKLSTGLAAGGIALPDIVLVEDDRIGGYVEAFPKGFLNLSEKEFKSNESAFPAFKLELAQVNETYYAFPFDAGPTGAFYRTDIFEQANVDASTIETWDEFIEAGKVILEKTGSQLLPADKFKDDANFRMMMNQLGVYYFDENGNIDFNNPKVIQVMETLQKLENAGLVKDVNGWDGTVSATIDGSVATVPFGAWYYGTIIDQAKDTAGKWGVMLLPAFEKGGNRAANLGGSSWMIPASTKNADEAYAFLEFFSLSNDVQLIAMDQHGLFPSLLTAYDSDMFNNGVEFFGNQSIWKLFADEMKDIPTPYYTNDYAIGLDEGVKAQADVFNGKDPAAALKEAGERLANRTGRTIN